MVYPYNSGKIFKRKFPKNATKFEGGRFKGIHMEAYREQQFKGGYFNEHYTTLYYYGIDGIDDLGRRADMGPEFFTKWAATKRWIAGGQLAIEYYGGVAAWAFAAQESEWVEYMDAKAKAFNKMLNKWMNLNEEEERASGLVLMQKRGHSWNPGSEYVKYYFYTGTGKYLGMVKL